MLETRSYTAGWSTAPKARPAYSGDTGDYGTPYYWYDEDGDIWYWNGYENEFIGYGSDGYIDEDTGEYMESNDAGWDYDDGLIDSLDIVAVVTELMEAFDVQLGVDDLTPENFNSVEAIEELIESRQS